MKNVLLLLRPHQWLKNTFIFLPLFFDKQLMNVSGIQACTVAFFAYCFMASSIYCFNDIHDREADRQHPKKKLRPIASGAISMSAGYMIMAVMFVLSLITITLLHEGRRLNVSFILLFYFAMNIAYCLYLKRIAIVDVFVIAMGFVFRIWVGGVAAQVWLSHWIILMTFLLAMFLAFAKRRDDVVLYEDSGIKVRGNINRYNVAFMNQVITVVATITMMCYIMYTVSEEVVSRVGSSLLYVTSVFVLAGIIRYLQLTIVDVRSGSPTKVLMRDRFVQCCIVGWIVVFALILYM